MVDDVDADGRTALMFAAASGKHRCVDVFLESGADLSYRDKLQKWTALHFAAQDGSTRVIRHLLRSGANYEIEARDKQTALDAPPHIFCDTVAAIRTM